MINGLALAKYLSDSTINLLKAFETFLLGPTTIYASVRPDLAAVNKQRVAFYQAKSDTETGALLQHFP